MSCQIEMAYKLAEGLFVPEVTARVREYERVTWLAEKERKAVVTKITGGDIESGFVYYIRINEQIKIGYSKDVTERMRHYPPGSELLAMEPGTTHTEKERHQDFGRDLERGREWFKESEKLAAHIAMLRETLGNPESLAYKFTTPSK